jgi:GH24 family phage-related lysozyme (muramidase)
MNKIFGAAAIVAFAFSIGLPSYRSTCCLNRAKAESVVRAQREQTWRYAFARSSSVVLSEGMV